MPRRRGSPRAPPRRTTATSAAMQGGRLSASRTPVGKPAPIVAQRFRAPQLPKHVLRAAQGLDYRRRGRPTGPAGAAQPATSGPAETGGRSRPKVAVTESNAPGGPTTNQPAPRGPTQSLYRSRKVAPSLARGCRTAARRQGIYHPLALSVAQFGLLRARRCAANRCRRRRRPRAYPLAGGAHGALRRQLPLIQTPVAASSGPGWRRPPPLRCQKRWSAMPPGYRPERLRVRK